jgi:hypothetical protein
MEESFTENLRSPSSKSPSIRSSLRKGFRNLLSPRSTHSASGQLGKQNDWDDEASFSDRQQDDDSDEFAADDDNDVDRYKVMAILCKELETVPSPPIVSQDTTPRKILKMALKSQISFTLRGRSKTVDACGSGDNNDSCTTMEDSYTTQKQRSSRLLSSTTTPLIVNLVPLPPPSPPIVSQDTTPRKILKKALKTQRSFTFRGRPNAGGRSGSGGNNDSCTNMEESSPSIGSSLRKGFRSILSPNRVDDASFSDRQEDDDSVEFVAYDYDDKDFDRDKFMAVLCKELEITLDDDEY